MQYNTRRAIIRRIKKIGNMKVSYNKMMKDKRYGKLTYAEFVEVRNIYRRKQVVNGYKWCNSCECSHLYTKEVFGYNGYKSDGTRRLHSVCLKARGQVKKNIRIMKDERYTKMRQAAKKNLLKNGNKRKRLRIADMTEDEKIAQRAKRRKYSNKRYLLNKGKCSQKSDTIN